jgi:uncharacterized protein YdhG (YjbR/CyaY superfamily)
MASSSPNRAAGVKAQVQAYLAARPPDVRRVLKQVRSIVRAAVPAATERFSYGIPGFTLEGRPLVWYAGFKHHYSLYPMGTAIRRRHEAALKGYPTSKGTIRFALADPVPVTLVVRLVKARATEARAEAKKKRAATSRTS